MTTFRKKDWVTGEVITESDMDRLEYGVLEANNVAQAVDIMLYAHANDTELHTPQTTNIILEESGAQPGGPRLLTTDDIDISGARLLTEDDLEAIDLTISNYAATENPLPTDDGYTVGSLWINTLDDKAFICTDDTPNSHVWVDISASGSNIVNNYNYTIVSGSGSTPDPNPEPVISNHNDLLNIQGGTAGDYYHLTSAQRSQLLAHITNFNNPHQTAVSGSTTPTTSTPDYSQNIFAEMFTVATAPSAGYWKGVAWSPERRIWVAVSTAGDNRLIHSYDGKNWSVGTPAGATHGWNDVCWSSEKGLFVAVSSNATPNLQGVMTSPDGLIWTRRDTPDRQWVSVCWSAEKNLFVAVARDTDAPNTVMTSPDGIVWTGRNASHAQYWEDVIWAPQLNNGSGYFIAVGAGGSANRAMYSANGTSWTPIATPGGIYNSWAAVCWSPELNLLVAVAYSASTTNAKQLIMTSTNGIDWVMRESTNAEQLLNVIWTPELKYFVACGRNPTTESNTLIKYSKDGINWSNAQIPLTSVAAGYLKGLGYSSTLGQIICTPSNNASSILVSPDISISTIDSIYAKYGRFQELYNNNYPVLTTKESIKTVNTAYTASVSDRVLLCSGTITVTLPPASSAAGTVLTIKNVGTGAITIDGYSAETIDGAATKALSSQYDSCRIICNGTLWYII